MAMYYVSNAAVNGFALGNDGNNGTDPSTPFLTIGAATSNGSLADGDTILVNDGIYDLGSGRITVTKNILLRPAGKALAVKIVGSHATDVIDVTPANNNTVCEIGAFEIVPRGCTRAIQIQNVAYDATVVLRGMKPHCGANSAITVSMTQGRCSLLNLVADDLLGSTSPWLDTGTAMATTSPMDFIVDGLVGTLTAVGTAINTALSIRRYTGGAPSQMNVQVRNVNLTVNVPSALGTAAATHVIRVDSIDNAVIEKNNVVVNAPGNSATNESVGINVTAAVASRTGQNCIVRDNVVDFNAAIGRALQIGDGSTQSYNHNCEVYRNTLTGRYWASNTPHGISLGNVTGGRVWGNKIYNFYAGILAGINNGGVIVGNLVVGCYGPSLFAKGCGATTTVKFLNNTCVCTNVVGKHRGYGLIGVAIQGATNNAATLFSGNLLIALDDLFQMVQVDASQVATFDGNNYFSYVPVRAGSPGLWYYQSAAVNDIASWTGTGTRTNETWIIPDMDANYMPTNRRLWGASQRAVPQGYGLKDVFGNSFANPPTIGAIEALAIAA